MTTSTYKGRDVYNDICQYRMYVSMGGRDQEMTFGIGRIDYSTLYGGTRDCRNCRCYCEILAAQQ